MWDEVLSEWGVWGLFISAFIASTLLPGGSEALLFALVLEESHSPWLLWGVASLGNSLGGMTSWLIGRLLAGRFPLRALKPERRRAAARLRRFGAPVLLLSWLPLVGDPLCVAAGWLRIHPLAAFVMIAIGKSARYLVIMILAGLF